MAMRIDSGSNRKPYPSAPRHGPRAPALAPAVPLLLATLLCLWSVSAWAAVRAFLDRDSITLGETVTLNVESDGQGGVEPDLAPLASNFRLLGTSSSTQISLVNGRQSARRLWAVALEPLAVGVLGIPALEVGGERTEPLTLTVLPAPRGATAAPGDEVFIEIEAGPRDPYVQQQVLYTLRLHYAVGLEGQLEEPQAAGVRVQRLGGDVRFQRRLGERRYEVIERRYALIPERSGTISVPALKFAGMASDGGFSGFMRSGRRIQVAGEAVELAVKPRPAQGRDPWLPATSLSLEDESGALGGPFRVGEPLTLALRIRAEGLSAEQLPALALPAIAGAQVYPDQESSQTRDGGERLVGERIRRFAVVPTRAGVLELPPLTIDWWDVGTDQPAQAALPARTLEVLPAVGQATAADPSAGAAGDMPASGAALDPAAAFWRWLALAMALLWLATLAWFWRRPVRREPPVPAAPRPRLPASELAAALASGRLDAIATALRCAPPATESGLDGLADDIEDPRQCAVIRRLERRLYGADPVPAGDDELLAELRAALAGGLRLRSTSARVADGSLPALYATRAGQERRAGA